MPERTCSHEGCEKTARLTRGLCPTHYSRLLRSGTMGAHDRSSAGFWRSVAITPSCWLWQQSLTKGGYGKAKFRGRTSMAHRVAWELLVGPIPDGLQIDHLCRVRHCVNPDHLEPVTPIENVHRSENANVRAHLEHRCTQGHPVTDENTYVNPRNGKVQCRVCLREWRQRRDARG